MSLVIGAIKNHRCTRDTRSIVVLAAKGRSVQRTHIMTATEITQQEDSPVRTELGERFITSQYSRPKKREVDFDTWS
jgi:hypothetical protein